MLHLLDLLPIPETPCNGCTACCKGEVPLTDNEIYPYEIHGNRRILKKKDDGSCIYLRENGCSVWPHAPKACMTYDCTVAVRLNLEDREEVIERAMHLNSQGYQAEIPGALVVDEDISRSL